MVVKETICYMAKWAMIPTYSAGDRERTPLLTRTPRRDNIDTIWIGSNLTPDEVTLVHAGNNLVLRIDGTSDSFDGEGFLQVRQRPEFESSAIQFMDGTVWLEQEDTGEDIVSHVSLDTEEGAFIYGERDEADGLVGGAGDDCIYGVIRPGQPFGKGR